MIEVDADASEAINVEAIVFDADASMSIRIALLMMHMLFRCVVAPTIQIAELNISSRQLMLTSILPNGNSDITLRLMP